MLNGSWAPQRAGLRTDQEYADLKIDLRLGTTATGFRPQDWLLQLDSRSDIRCDALIIATGMRARQLRGCRVDGVHVLRTLDDAMALRADLLEASRLVVIGAGALGLEAAASARRLGLDVTVVETVR